MSGAASNPVSASRPAIRPDNDPRDWWNLIVGVPQWANVPADWLPASPSAFRCLILSSPRILPELAAPPNGPMTPGECQPRARNSG